MNMVAQPIELSALRSVPESAPLVAPGALPFLNAVKVQATVRVGRTETTVGQLLAMKPGELLALDRLVDQPLDVLVGEHVVARGTLVAVGDHFGVCLTELPTMSASGVSR